MIYNDYKVPVAGDTFVLDEDNENATCRMAKFSKRGGEVLVFKFDKAVDISLKISNSKKRNKQTVKLKLPFPFFNELPGLKAMADYIIFFKKANGNNYAVICNLKSKNRANHPNQVKAAEIFIDFIIRSVYRQFGSLIQIDFVRKVLFSEQPAKKYSWNIYKEKKTNREYEWSYQSIGENSDVCNLDAICNT